METPDFPAVMMTEIEKESSRQFEHFVSAAPEHIRKGMVEVGSMKEILKGIFLAGYIHGLAADKGLIERARQFTLESN